LVVSVKQSYTNSAYHLILYKKTCMEVLKIIFAHKIFSIKYCILICVFFFLTHKPGLIFVYFKNACKLQR
jgi:hypothetical protein